MRDAFQDVLDFHKKFQAKIGTTPAIPDTGTVDFRIKILEEEYQELIDALTLGDLVKIADACADLIYVVIGLAISYGIYLPDIWEEIHESNMRKTGGRRGDGKVMKGLNWTPPDVARILKIQGPLV